MRLSLGPYLLGALDATERVEVERHLAACGPCRAESDELTGTGAALGLFSEQESRDIIAEFGITRPVAGSGPQVTDQPSAEPARPAKPPPGSRRPGGVTRPKSRGPGRQRWSGLLGRRRRGTGLLGVAALVLVVFISATIVVSLLVGDQGGGGRQDQGPVRLAATAGASNGATLSVVAVTNGTGVTVRATVSGLRPDTTYKLYVVTLDDQTRQITTWVGSAAPHDLTARRAGRAVEPGLLHRRRRGRHTGHLGGRPEVTLTTRRSPRESLEEHLRRRPPPADVGHPPEPSGHLPAAYSAA
ncbi:zf-HC2 domain-containing protein [Fodinicola feengrottensis]|uniref:zf-HC2 domain-containing protein n=1 Tax=Fodinicola feengrottensis TaxID=435914 RepID=UPI0013D02421|nr:zf-HC2 domain-containing protein [Fodinicola feengrottensis]